MSAYTLHRAAHPGQSGRQAASLLPAWWRNQHIVGEEMGASQSSGCTLIGYTWTHSSSGLLGTRGNPFSLFFVDVRCSSCYQQPKATWFLLGGFSACFRNQWSSAMASRDLLSQVIRNSLVNNKKDKIFKNVFCFLYNLDQWSSNFIMHQTPPCGRVLLKQRLLGSHPQSY